MKILLTVLLAMTLSVSSAQNGYVILDNDSTITGFLKYYTSIHDGEPGIELWKTKTDKNPRRIPKRLIAEYAIKKDTFKVFYQFQPFHDSDAYFELVEGKLESRGKINLYIITNYPASNRISTYTGGGIVPGILDEAMGNHAHLYVLENNSTGFYKGLPAKKEKLQEALLDFFPDRYISKYAEVNGEIKYKTIPEFVKLYNSK